LLIRHSKYILPYCQKYTHFLLFRRFCRLGTRLEVFLIHLKLLSHFICLFLALPPLSGDIPLPPDQEDGPSSSAPPPIPSLLQQDIRPPLMNRPPPMNMFPPPNYGPPRPGGRPPFPPPPHGKSDYCVFLMGLSLLKSSESRIHRSERGKNLRQKPPCRGLNRKQEAELLEAVTAVQYGYVAFKNYY